MLPAVSVTVAVALAPGFTAVGDEAVVTTCVTVTLAVPVELL